MGKKLSKSSPVEDNPHALTKAELNALMASTKMSRQEILKWHKGFMIDCPSGRLSKKEFLKIYEELFPTCRAKKFCELVFNVFDKDQTNTIDFSEFIMACSLTSRGKPKDKLALAFDVYQSYNEDILLKKEDVKLITEAVHELYEGRPLSKDKTMSKLNLFMDTLDITDSDSIRVSKSEFLERMSNDSQIRRQLYSRQVSVESLPI